MTTRSDLGDITPNNLGQVRVLHKALFPVHYNDNFYTDLLEVGEFAKLVYYNDVCVGTVCCRKEADEANTNKTKIYIMTLGVLEPYRHLGLGNQLVQHILEQAKLDNDISKVFLHVQISNTVATEFYQKNGFKIVSTEKDYYKNIEPRDAYLLEKMIEH
ncbi:acyl-CoA N-acyltransferase [Cokeromyces recurvatus]|uniref:acyl-CoA N-acyltransferase n=1 Tax=Cokeromyces recurvatus TaxID=90255 RepID=UPI00221E6745|nr:acyl-CoA N-acyltransferase [Cokeromyces recurvatus]KAI7905405.1 acyl-CoA N-acyltransferase [Cokeromyces recurvatus]